MSAMAQRALDDFYEGDDYRYCAPPRPRLCRAAEEGGALRAMACGPHRRAGRGTGRGNLF
eukprot:2419213-Prymnesium_polylepis.1